MKAVKFTITRNSNASSAEICRQNKWERGTMLVGDEGYGPEVIRITAVGDESILALSVSRKGKPVDGHEGMWTLEHRNWKEVDKP